MRICLSIIMLFCIVELSAATKLPKKFGLTFKSNKELSIFKQVAGKKTLSTSMSTKKGSGSMELAPGSSFELELFEKKDGVGTVTVKFYDDMTVPADATATRRGPSFGLRNKDGFEFSIGVLYASFADGATYYYLNHYRYTDKSQTPTKWVKHIRCKRSKGWQEFTFEFDGSKGLLVKHNGKDINHGLGDKKFDWKEIKFGSFDRLVFHGDKAGKDAQTVYIDDITVQLGKEGVKLKQ